MIDLLGGRRIFVHREPVDMRKAFDGLTALASAHFKRDVLAGDVFVFVGRDRKRLKAIVWDGTGLCLLAKRMAKGRFAAPWSQPGARTLELSRSELGLLFEGAEIALKQPSPPRYTSAPPLEFR